MSSALACAGRSMRSFSSIARSLPSSSTQLRHPKRPRCLGSASINPHGHHGAGSLAAQPATTTAVMVMTVRAQTNSASSPRPTTSSPAPSAAAQPTTPYSRTSLPNPSRPTSNQPPPLPPRPPPPPPPSSSSSQAPQGGGAPNAPRPAEPYYSAPNEKSHVFADGLNDAPVTHDSDGSRVDWTRSYHGLSEQPFSKEAAEVLQQPISPDDIEVKPDGIMYLPEIKYRRILNKAFGPGGWGLAPRGETIITDKSVTREYALVAHGRLVSVARGEQDYFSMDNIPTAVEGCKSNAMMRCCKDLGVASELWDPRFCRTFMAEHAKEVFVENVLTRKRRKIWMRKDDTVRYPYKAT